MRTTRAILLVVMFLSLVGGQGVQANFIGDLEGLQRFGGATWHPSTDEYLVTFTGGGDVCAVRIDSGGKVLSNTRVAPSAEGNLYNLTEVQANPVNRTYLVTYRNDEPAIIRGRFLGQNSVPISDQFVITGQGGGPHIAFNPIANLYLVSYNFGFKAAFFRTINGPVSNTPALTPPKRFDEEFIAKSSFSTRANKFLYVTAKGHPPDPETGEFRNGSDIWGRFVTGDGSSAGPRFGIATTPSDETGVRVGYSPSSNRWLAIWQRHIGGNRSFDVEAALIDENGNKTHQFFIATTSGWEVPSAVEYNASMDRFVVVWFNSNPRVALVNPYTGEVEHIRADDQITTPRQNPLGDGVNAVATREGPANPQVLIVWREGHGADGINGTIVDLQEGFEIPISGGGIPCTDAPQQTADPDALDDLFVDEDDSDPDPLIPLFTPDPQQEPELLVEKFVRNITKGETASGLSLTQVRKADIVQFITRITSQTDRTVTGLTVYDQMPGGLSFRENSTLVDGTTVPGEAVISEAGLTIGDIVPGSVRIVRWSAQVQDTDIIGNGFGTVEVPVVVQTANAGVFFSDAALDLSDEFIAARSAPVNIIRAVQGGLNESTSQGQSSPGNGSSAQGASLPSTGAGGTLVLALVGAVMASLAYAGYTRSGYFHRKQIREISKGREPMDFRM